MLNFLYVLDENYNLPMLSSIISLLENITKPICIYVIHKNPETFQYEEQLITNYDNLVNLEIFKFDHNKSNFQSIAKKFDKDQHYTEATYYKLFLSDYLPKEVKEVVYIDPDVICLNNPTDSIQQQFKYMNNKFIVGASTHAYKKTENEDLFKRLSIDEKYFNAGVMFINLETWRSKNITSKIISYYEENYQKIIWADQDLINSFLNGNYFEISELLNYPISSANQNHIDKNYLLKEVLFAHFIGKDKPWSISGIVKLDKFYNLYQDNFYRLNVNKYHLDSKNLTKDIFLVLRSSFKKKEKLKLIYNLFTNF